MAENTDATFEHAIEGPNGQTVKFCSLEERKLAQETAQKEREEQCKKNVLLDVNHLDVTLFTEDGALPAVSDLSFIMRKGETLAVVGESGCGKSMTALSVMGLLPTPPAQITGGEIIFEGTDLTQLPRGGMRDFRGNRIGMIFQEPMTSLNPIMTIGEQMYEVIHRTNAYGEDYDERAIAIDLLKKMGLSTPERRLSQYPHELSGGMRQRVCIAMAVAGRPKILICDEPTTALDITTEAQILRLMQTLAVEAGIGIIFISHNLRVIAQICDRVMVMYAGKCVESATVDGIFSEPRHPYTLGLLLALPQGKWHGELKAVEGQPPDLFDLPRGCAFNPRCKWAMRICGSRVPMVTNVGESHQFTCWLAKLEGL